MWTYCFQIWKWIWIKHETNFSTRRCCFQIASATNYWVFSTSIFRFLRFLTWILNDRTFNYTKLLRSCIVSFFRLISIEFFVVNFRNCVCEFNWNELFFPSAEIDAERFFIAINLPFDVRDYSTACLDLPRYWGKFGCTRPPNAWGLCTHEQFHVEVKGLSIVLYKEFVIPRF